MQHCGSTLERHVFSWPKEAMPPDGQNHCTSFPLYTVAWVQHLCLTVNLRVNGAASWQALSYTPTYITPLSGSVV
eukprot:230412-Prorocentrum_minimum.AAC.3